MSKYGPWKCHGKDDMGSDLDVFRLDEQESCEHEYLDDESWLLWRSSDGLTIEFAVFEWFHGPSTDGALPAEYTMLLHGSGPAGKLRECRHIWWGEDGYTHMTNFDLIARAAIALRKWFDI